MSYQDNGYETRDLVCKGVLNKQSTAPHRQLQYLIVKSYHSSIKSFRIATNLTWLTEVTLEFRLFLKLSSQGGFFFFFSSPKLQCGHDRNLNKAENSGIWENQNIVLFAGLQTA